MIEVPIQAAIFDPKVEAEALFLQPWHPVVMAKRNPYSKILKP